MEDHQAASPDKAACGEMKRVQTQGLQKSESEEGHILPNKTAAGGRDRIPDGLIIHYNFLIK